MQHLEHVLRSMKRIVPDEAYAASSRATILNARVAVPRVTLAAFFRTAGIAAMASLAFVGGLSIVRLALPTQVGRQSVNQQALAAEAQAVDSQLALADVQHQVVVENSDRRITPAAANVAKSAAGASSDSSVDRALDALSQ